MKISSLIAIRYNAPINALLITLQRSEACARNFHALFFALTNHNGNTFKMLT